MEGTDYAVNENGIPCCPHDSTLPMKREGSKSHLRSKLPTMKFVCPKMKWMCDKQTGKTYRKCHCDNPCTTSSCGRMIYIYPEKNLRAYPGVERGSREWEDTYKIRVNDEKSINHFKDSFCIANRKTQNEKKLHADLLQYSYRIFNQDCELVSQLPIIYVLYRKFYIFKHVKELSNFLVIR